MRHIMGVVLLTAKGFPTDSPLVCSIELRFGLAS